jgi:hypothetical protein
VTNLAAAPGLKIELVNPATPDTPDDITANFNNITGHLPPIHWHRGHIRYRLHIPSEAKKIVAGSTNVTITQNGEIN